MGTAREFPTPQTPTTLRRAYHLDPPFTYDTYSGGEFVTATVEYIVISNNFSEVMAFPGRTVTLASISRVGVKIASMTEVAVLTGRHRIRTLLTQMGYRTVIDRNGLITEITERGAVENHGRWGQGAPGSDDYMSFGI